MAKLDIIIGPMFAGKSTELIKRIRQLRILDKVFKIIKPKIDNRYSNNEIGRMYNLTGSFISTMIHWIEKRLRLMVTRSNVLL